MLAIFLIEDYIALSKRYLYSPSVLSIQAFYYFFFFLCCTLFNKGEGRDWNLITCYCIRNNAWHRFSIIQFPSNGTFWVLIKIKICLHVPRIKMICLLDRYFLLVLFLNLEYTHTRTHTDKHKFARALYILKCNYFPDSFFNT